MTPLAGYWPPRFACRSSAVALTTWGLTCAALAQTPTTPTPTPTSTSTSTPAASVRANSTAVYQDRVIEGLAAQDPEELAQRQYDSTGLPRSYSLEALWDQRRTQGGSNSTLGLKASVFVDTLQYGSLSGQLTTQENTPAQGAAKTSVTSYVLRQVGMPFDGGWRADNAAGMINLPITDMARASPRFSLPAPAMQGISTSWRQSAGLNLMAAFGQAGRFDGYQLPGFTTAPGNYSMLGLQDEKRVSDGLWQWSAAAAQAQGVSSSLAASPTGQGLLNAQALYAAARREWQSGAEPGSFAQLNAVNGHSNGTDFTGRANPAASALWADGGFAQGPHKHSWGAFWLEPGLAWLDNPLPSNLKGAYWRHGWRTRQWSTESSLELLGSVSGNTPQGFFASSSARYQYSTGTSFGGTASVRRYGLQAQSLLLYTQFANALGSTRLQADVSSANTGERQWRMQVDHDWSFVQSMRLSTALSADRSRTATGTNRGLGAALNADWDLNPRLTMNSSLQSRWSDEATQYSLSAGLTWRINTQWALQANLYATEGNPRTSALAQSPLTAPALLPTRTHDRGVFVSLRYTTSAGASAPPIGGAPGSAAGQLSGMIYLDANKNGKRDAGERGAANVTVVLDGRYSVQTDAQGRFDFNYVVAGPHVITVVSDNLPLPWVLENNGRTPIKVFTRDMTQVAIGAVQP